MSLYIYRSNESRDHYHKVYTLSVKTSSAKSDERRNFLPTKISKFYYSAIILAVDRKF